MTSNLEVVPLWSYSLLALGFYVCLVVKAWISRSKMPKVGVEYDFEPSLVSSFRFYKNAEAILLHGYSKASPSFLIVNTRSNIGCSTKIGSSSSLGQTPACWCFQPDM